MKKTKLKSISQLKKQADKVFSLWIRARDGTCYTCVIGNADDCGHYISRSYLNLRYSEINCHGQCKSCNIFKSGNLTNYAIRLINDYGIKILHDLDYQKRLKVGNPREFYENVISKYK